MDNTTPHQSTEYDTQVARTIPGYERFFAETIGLVKAYLPHPGIWLDTGCGTGTMALLAMREFRDTRFILADPSEGMLAQAKTKLAAVGANAEILAPTGSAGLPGVINETPDIITAVMCHHYLDPAGRKAAVSACRSLLREGGLFVTFENIRPFTARGTEIGLRRWKEFQLSAGRPAETVDKHMTRFGTEYFPITAGEHLDLLRECGFSTVEILFYGTMQAGFYAVK
ncbi:MAG: class I SAM-dependent methyltransferase [Brevinematales bacterium]|nr:class I SAM-dependent methyltransferase [Brevinematales bacterium]